MIVANNDSDILHIAATIPNGISLYTLPVGSAHKIKCICLIVQAKMSMTMQVRYSISKRVLIYFSIDLSEFDYEGTKRERMHRIMNAKFELH